MQKSHPSAQKENFSMVKIKIICCICFLLFSFIWLDFQLRPVISTMAASQCKIAATLAINQAIEQELSENASLYQELYHIQYLPDGTISSVSADVSAVNNAKSHLTAAVLQRLENLKQEKISIPLGTLLGWQLLAGRGPEISMRTVPSGFANTKFYTKLQSEGINQTMLLGYIQFHVEINVILPGFSSTQTIKDEVCINQTLVVGKVPHVYAQLP